MALVLTSGPAVEPVTLAEAKALSCMPGAVQAMRAYILEQRRLVPSA